MSMWIVALLFIVAVLVQAFARYGFGPRTPIGDENEYIARGRSADVLAPKPFLRVPAMALLTRMAGQRHAEERLRDMMALLSLVAAAFVAGAGYVAMGAPGAIGAGLIFVLWPDRILLSQHIWPDILLAAWQSLLLLMIAYSSSVTAVSPWLFGVVVAAAVMTRIDSIILLPAITIIAAMVYEQLLPTLPALWVPSLALLGLYTVRNGWRYGLWLPDTTILFNVSIMAEEQRRGAGDALPVEGLVQAVLPRWDNALHHDRMLAFRNDVSAVARQPRSLMSWILRRTWQMLGPDAFAVEILLHRERGAYLQLPAWLRRSFAGLLRIGFPVLCALAIAGASTCAVARLCLIPAGASFLAACLGHARTRFRYQTLPALSFAATAGLLGVTHPELGWIIAFIALVAGSILLRAPWRREMEQ